MVQSTKILTVSYGTFSCTLEGFDDSFETMKAIAEYFRDLAADDRYFGAEPPQPDADALARIAQREVARQVEARQSDSGIILRASDYQPPAGQTPSAQTAAAAGTAALTAATVPPVGPGDAVRAEPVASDPAPQTPEMVEPEPELVASPAETSDSDKPSLSRIPVPEAEEYEEPGTSDFPSDSIADKLRRIRAVVSRKDESIGEDQASPYTEPYSEDEHADIVIADAVKDLTLAIEADAEDPEPEIEEEDEVSSVLARLEEAHAEAEDETPEQQAEAEDAAPEPDDDQDDEAEEEGAENSEPRSDPLIHSWSQGATTPLDVIAGTAQDDPQEPDVDEPNVTATEDVAAEDGLFTNLVSEAAEDGEGVTDIDTDDPDEIVNILGDAPAGAIAEIPLESSLSAEDEADLMQELAQAEAERQTGSAEQDLTLADTEDAPAGDRETWLSGAEGADDDVSRLMAAAEEKMDAPESSTNRETYSHLRAAVAAAEAERSVRGEADDTADDDPYRQDLANVVRPRRPSNAPITRPARPLSEARPAPLKLVAEQRVDIDTPNSSSGTIVPRRVSADTADGIDDNKGGGGFAAYAEEMGASELPELLEAAASYLAFVEGRDQFSRPQLMNKVRQLDNHDFNREDGLRSFGKLLREGKIQKKGGGRFAASGDIGFRPDARAAG